jgi:hypothetical protein
MKLCSHVVTHDSGLAPNPLHGYCTSAVCTPSHMNARLEEGDWLVGNSPRRDGNRLVYAMRISKVMSMNQYFRSEMFGAKKPKADGAPEEQCGDNIYYQNEDATWRRLPSVFHNDHKSFAKDVGSDRAGRPVFVAEHFYYFGKQRVSIPLEFARVIQGQQGIHYTRGQPAHDFVAWLEANHTPGRFGTPRDMADHSAETSTTLSDLSAGGPGPTKSQGHGGCGPMSRSVTKTQPRKRC